MCYFVYTTVAGSEKDGSLYFRLKLVRTGFKRFTSRLLKLSFSLSMHLSPRMNVMLDFIERCQSSGEEHGTSEHYKKILLTVGFEPATPAELWTCNLEAVRGVAGSNPTVKKTFL